MKSFYIFENKDSAKAYIQALKDGGFEHVKHMEDADFLLYDSEGVGGRFKVKEAFLKKGVGFIYPHTPLTCYLWDGIYKPLPVACNFVSGRGQRACMKAYEYPYRVESVGFSRCEVLPFQRARGNNLLFVPARPRRDHGRQEVLDRAALDFIIKYRSDFDSVTCCRIDGQFEEYKDGDHRIHFMTTIPSISFSPANDMIQRIDNHDIVIAVTTPAALAVARGKPTIMYGQNKTPETLTGNKAKSYEKYRDVYAYPHSLEAMTIQDVMNLAESGSTQMEQWKKNHIGGNFNAEAFLSIVREYVL